MISNISVLSYNITAWFGDLNSKYMSKLVKFTNVVASKPIRRPARDYLGAEGEEEGSVYHRGTFTCPVL